MLHDAVQWNVGGKRVRYRLLVILPVIVMGLVACGKKEDRPHWPAQITSFEGFSKEEETHVKESIGSLNDHADEKLVSEENKGYKIRIRKVDGTDWPKARAGYATVDDSDCLVELSKQIFEDAKSDYIMSVVWHELGHCAGLTHDSKNGEVMSAITAPFTAYSTDALARFMKAIKQSTGL